ncbi:type II restriction endonuclease subunit M [Pseudoalteromonas phenolica]|uniref:Eco57I restriction-modification methylase domain-containing protein n=1 Tax=Pseudoalteromonas phenolica TaxID=161398 RepID=UPI00110C01C5|nr:N-6 DNA methylase [Pseudoalteromonas phenolica]TMN87007.1 type II restriction endonuclease subunit M [Pseudoalteromonas phenolica]
MLEVAERYEHVECRKSEGAHYTSSQLSNFVSQELVSFNSNFADQKIVRIADPAIGDGELIISLLSRINDNKEIEVFGFDTNEISLEKAQRRINELFPNVTFKAYFGDFLDQSLSHEFNEIKFDFIIANPPYIRTQVLGAEKAQVLAKQFGLKGRVDIYQAFLVATSKVLSPNGVAGYIVSNRFLTTKGSGTLRNILSDLYSIEKIVDFGDTKLFEAAVLPAVMFFKLKVQNHDHTEFVSIYESTESCNSEIVSDSPISALEHEGVISCSNGKTYEVRKGFLTYDASPKDVWRIQDTSSEIWLNNIEERTYLRFKDIGKIRVGIKTTADNVFIKDNWEEEVGVVPELVRPLITHHVGNKYTQSVTQRLKGVLYTHTTVSGKKRPVSIEDYPISEEYLNSHKEQLSSRNYVIKAKRNWWEIWVPQNPELWSSPKVVFRDICESPTFWFDDTNSIVNGDCYWLVKDNEELEDSILFLLLAVANSKFIEDYYDIKFNNKLYSNKRRFMSQYVENFPLPDPNSDIALELIELVEARMNCETDIERTKLESAINSLVYQAFGLN